MTLSTHPGRYLTRCLVATKNHSGHGYIDHSAPAAWLGQYIAVTPPPGKDYSFETVRGCWTITHRGCGFALAYLNCSLKTALKLAKQWDQRAGSIDPLNSKAWQYCQQWGAAVKAINLPNIEGRARFAHNSTDAAAVLAAERGLSIDQAGGHKRILWRGKYWPAPTDAELELWTLDSVCETPDGRMVEPDNSESWLTILGLV